MQTSAPLSRRHALGAGLALAGASALGLLPPAQALAAPPTPAPTKPVRLPALTLMDIHGRPYRLNENHGKVLMVNFWATWCPPCRAEMPSIELLVQAMRGKPLEVLGLNQGEPLQKVKAGLATFTPPMTFPILLDAAREVGKHFEIEDLPTTLLFNKQGLLVGRANGHRDFNHPSVHAMISALMEETP